MAADPNDHALSIATLLVTATIGLVSVWRQRKRDRQDRVQAENTAVVDSIGTLGTLAVDIAKEIVAGTDDMISAHRAEVSDELEALRSHVAACDELTARQQERIAALEARLVG